MKKFFFKKNNKNKGGYTLIETMISISLFLIIVMEGMGALLNANRLHNKSQSMRSVVDNLSFVMEDISRNLRTGYNYQCFNYGDPTQQTLTQATLGAPRNCANGWALAFEYQNGVTPDPISGNQHMEDQWVYYIDNGKIFKSIDGATTFIQLTPDEVVIDPASSFVVIGAEPPPGDSKQPFVTIKLVGSITVNNVVSPFILQTSVSQRVVDI